MAQARIFAYFQQLSTIPRGSFKLDGVRTFLFDWATSHGFSYTRDTYGNVVVAVNQSGNAKPVIVQSHMDMVCVKNDESTHDFTTDPIELVQTTDAQGRTIMKANKTTLGADNGIGLCSTMVLLEDMATDNPNLPVYMLATADEEEGLLGAKNLDPSILPQDAYLINVDSEEDGQVCAGNSGGSQCSITFKGYKSPMPHAHIYQLNIFGLPGGHSGIDINKGGRPSALKLTNQVYRKIQQTYQESYTPDKHYICLMSMVGGDADNAIPAHCSMTFAVKTPTNKSDELANMTKIVSDELSYLWATLVSSGKLKFTLEECPQQDYGYAFPSVSDAVALMQQGIIHMHESSHEFVDTSTNVGLVKMRSESEMEFVFLTRSATTSRMERYYEDLRVLASTFRGVISDYEGYGGWSPDWNTNVVLRSLRKTYQQLFAKDCTVQSVHAGLEVSALLAHYPKWECMSIGPQVNNAHSATEELVVDTVEPFYQWLHATVEDLSLGTN